MKILQYICLLLAFQANSLDAAIATSNPSIELFEIERQWAAIDETLPGEAKKQILTRLQKQTKSLVQSNPDATEAVIVLACLQLSIANLANPFSALSLIKESKKLLIQAMENNPDARYGSAVYTLGVLYHKVPGWPISFGDDKKAEELLLTAIQRNPDSIGGNYFYGEFLCDKNRHADALPYFLKASQGKASKQEPLKVKLIKKARLALERVNTMQTQLN